MAEILNGKELAKKIRSNLKTEVEKHGEQFQGGKLSEYEKKYLTNKINNLAGVVLFIEEKTTKNNNAEVLN